MQKRLEASPNLLNASETDLYLYGWVEGSALWDGEDIIATNEVRETLLKIKSNVINVHINSCGGSAYDGIAIHNLLKQHPARINVYIDGMAASAASLIAMAGDRIFMPDNTMMLIHRASCLAYGNAEELRNEAAELEKLDSAVYANYKPRFKGSEDELRKIISEGKSMTAAECLQYGFCDEILQSAPENGQGKAAPQNKKTTAELIYELFINMKGEKK